MIIVAVVCRAKAFEDTRHKVGWWSYPVDGLAWQFVPVQDGARVDVNALARDFQAVIWEDWVWPEFVGSAIPVVSVVVDANTSDRRLARYHATRQQYADVILMDQGDLRWFADTGKPVYRWTYGVNEQVFHPVPKTVDVAYHVGKTDERNALALALDGIMRTRPYTYTRGNGLAAEEYAQKLRQARIVVHKSTHPQCRSHRFFDALACHCCLLTDKVEPVSEDGFIPGVHFVEYTSPDDLSATLDDLLTFNRWQEIARNGYEFVMSRHTWAHRAQELRAILERELARA